MRIKTQLRAGTERLSANHNQTLAVRTSLGRKAMKRAVLTTLRNGDRLELMVVRAGLRAGRARDRVGRR